MIFSTIDRSFSHSSRARNLLEGVGRFGTVFGAPRMNRPSYSDGREKGFGFLRGYINLASNDFNFNLSDFKSIGAIPRLLRLFSNEAPKKNYYENVYPKEKKQVPKGDDSKQESKGLIDASNPCCTTWANGTLGCIPMSKPCMNPSKHFFWDGYHLAEAVYSIIAYGCLSDRLVCRPVSIQELFKMNSLD
ncbi:hypothetical protein OROGR_018048 [Orobanche gracilis]